MTCLDVQGEKSHVKVGEILSFAGSCQRLRQNCNLVHSEFAIETLEKLCDDELQQGTQHKA